MIDLVTPSTLEELYVNERSRYEGTIFSDIESVLSKHEPVLEFMIQNRDAFTPDAFIGSEKAFFQDGVEIDDVEFISALRNSPVMLDDYLSFQRDIALFHYTALQEKTNNWGEVLQEIAKISDGTEEEIHTIFSEKREQIQSDFDSILEDAKEGEISEHEFRVLQQVNSQYQTATQRQLLLHSFKERIDRAEALLGQLTYLEGNEPTVGQYFVYRIRPHPDHIKNKMEYDIDFNSNTVFAVIGKVTGRHTVEEESGLIEVAEYDFDIIAYDTEVLELYDRFWLLEKDNGRLSPIYQDSYELYDENPLGEVETKYEDTGSGPEWW